jgi:hypothetical protein
MLTSPGQLYIYGSRGNCTIWSRGDKIERRRYGKRAIKVEGNFFSKRKGRKDLNRMRLRGNGCGCLLMEGCTGII